MVPRFGRGVGPAGECVGGAFRQTGVWPGVPELVAPPGADAASAIYRNGNHIEMRASQILSLALITSGIRKTPV